MGLKILSGVIVWLCLLQFSKTSPVQSAQKVYDSSVKLRPLAYDLNIRVFPDEEKFSGEVTIAIEWLQTSNVITVNVNQSLTIKDTEVVVTKAHSEKPKEEEFIVQKTEKHYDTSTFNIVLEKTFNAGDECDVKIKFSGKLNTNNTEGLFKKTYLDASTKQSKWIIGSNFKSHTASLAFPCFEDATFKTPFRISIERPSKLNSLSTMNLLKTENMERGWAKDVYPASPPMALSSLAIFVSDLTPVSYNKSGVELRIWPVPELSQAIRQNRSEILFKSLDMYGDAFGIDYPLSKLDYIALPSSAATNVDNTWGLVISSENNLGENKLNEKIVITSELAGQWMGCVVTPESNDQDIEAFVNFLNAFYNSKYLKKENENVWHTWPASSQYANYYEFGAPTASDNAEIRRMSIFSKTTIVYRMMAYVLTEKTFSSALKNFIKEKKYSTFKMDDFWEALDKQAHLDGNLPSGVSAKEIAKSWMDKYRLPYVDATRNYNAKSAHLTQRLFIRKRPRSIVKDEAMLWNIPIVLKTEDKADFQNTKPAYWMKERELNIKNVADSNKFIIINPEEIAPFMVNYDNTNWQLLTDFLHTEQRTKIPVFTRAKLVHDALNLAYAGSLNFATALNLTVYLKHETEYLPWKPFFIMFDHIGRYIDGTKVLKKYQTYVKLLAKPMYDRLKATEKKREGQPSDFLKEVRAVLRNLGDEQILKEANSAYDKWMQNPSKGYEAVSQYLCTIYEFGTKEQWEFGLKTVMNLEGKPEIERSYLLKSLVGCVEDDWKIKKILNMTLFEQNNAFTDDDFKYAAFMLTGGAGYMSVFEYLKDNWNVLKVRLQDKPEIWDQLIYTATSMYKTQEGLNQVSELYAKHRGQFGEAEKIIQESLQKIKEEVQWNNENLSTLEDWLDNYILKNSPQE